MGKWPASRFRGDVSSSNSGWVGTSFRYQGQETLSRAHCEKGVVLKVGRRQARERNQSLSEEMGLLCCRNLPEEVELHVGLDELAELPQGMIGAHSL